MVDTELTVTVNADTDDAVDAIERVTDAVEDLNAALRELGGAAIDFDIKADSSGNYDWDLINGGANTSVSYEVFSE